MWVGKSKGLGLVGVSMVESKLGLALVRVSVG